MWTLSGQFLIHFYSFGCNSTRYGRKKMISTYLERPRSYLSIHTISFELFTILDEILRYEVSDQDVKHENDVMKQILTFVR